MKQELKNLARVMVLLLCGMVAWSANADIRIATVGDSITQGVPGYQSNGNGCTNCGGYQPWLELLIDAESWSVGAVYNYGIAGELSNGGAARIPGIIDSINPEYVLYMEGTNDLWYFSPGTVRDRVRSAVNNILAQGKIPVIGTLLPDTRGNANNDKGIPDANNVIRAMLVDKGVQLAELYLATSFSGWANLMADGLHPNSAGYNLMAQTWYTALGEAGGVTVGFLPAVYLLLLE